MNCKSSKRYSLAPAVLLLKYRKGDVDAFKRDVCEVMGWKPGSIVTILYRGVVNIGVPQYEALNEVMDSYGIQPHEGWEVKEVTA